ncbi:hypothetical protein HQ560_08375 [bacterium]|nr:hypothetical protein [bacterium]
MAFPQPSVSEAAIVAVGLSLVIVGCQGVDIEEPLPLDDGPAPVTRKKGADNKRCQACHANYEAEPFAVIHARKNVGCVDCHGKSDAHCKDEKHLTPPDKMYTRDGVNAACMECHPADYVKHKLVHKRLLAGDMQVEKVCIDCHGDHRLVRRAVRWDKKTRKLLPEEKK